MQTPSVCSSRDVVRPAAEDTVRVALLTPPGRGALAVVGVVGTEAIRLVSRCFVPHGPIPLVDRAAGAVCVGRWGPGGEEVVVVRRDAQALEVHCHGGLAAAEAIMAGMDSLGATRLRWPEWFACSGADDIEIEAREALARAGGVRSARILARQLSGELRRELDRVRTLLAGDTGRAAPVVLPAVTDAIGRLRRAARVGLRLTRPWRVVVTGDVNAGKSSLVNALAGSARSLVSPLPGTTRDVLETRLAIAGWEVDLVDTAGLRDPVAADPVESEGIARATAAAAHADLVLRAVDCRKTSGLPVEALEPRELLVLTKSDLQSPARSADGGHSDGDRGAAATRAGARVRTSAVTGEGIEQLLSAIIDRLVPEERLEPTLLSGAVPFTPRQVALIDGLLPAAASAGAG